MLFVLFLYYIIAQYYITYNVFYYVSIGFQNHWFQNFEEEFIAKINRNIHKLY